MSEPRIERAGPKAQQPYFVEFSGGKTRFLTVEAAAAYIGRLMAYNDPRVVAARAAADDVWTAVADEFTQAALEANKDVAP